MSLGRETRSAVSQAWEKLCSELTRKQIELRRRETSIGTSHDLAKINRLRKEIDSLEKRLILCEAFLDRPVNG